MPRVLSETEIAEEISKISNVMNWPRWPILPVKNLQTEFMTLGIMVAHEGVEYVVFEGNMIADNAKIKPSVEAFLNGREPELPAHVFNSWRELVEAGWVGD